MCILCSCCSSCLHLCRTTVWRPYGRDRMHGLIANVMLHPPAVECGYEQNAPTMLVGMRFVWVNHTTHRRKAHESVSFLATQRAPACQLFDQFPASQDACSDATGSFPATVRHHHWGQQTPHSFTGHVLRHRLLEAFVGAHLFHSHHRSVHT